jgi:SAM-dependent methyltransferase
MSAEPAPGASSPEAAVAAAKLDIAYYNKLAKVYFDRHEWPIQRLATRIEERWLNRVVRDGASVLVVGVGGGRELDVLLRKGCRLTAADYSPEMVELGKRHWAGKPVEWLCADVHDLSQLEGRRFDAVICLAAVNYFVDAALAMRNMANTLDQGGTLIISSINRVHVTERNAAPPSPGHHRTLYSPDEMRRLAIDAGLDVTGVRGMRAIVDRLPPKWNSGAPDRWRKLLLDGAIALDEVIAGLIPPAQGKFFWLIAKRPG